MNDAVSPPGVDLIQGLDLIRTVLDEAEEVRDPLEGLVEATRADCGAPFAPEVLARLVELKTDDRAAFEALRSELKAVGCRVGALDKALEAAEREAREDLARPDRGDSAGTGDAARRAGSQASQLLELAEGIALFHAPDRAAYADLLVDGHRQTWRLRAGGFQQWLRGRYFGATGGAPSADALASALGALEARALFAGPERPVFVRVGEQNRRIYLDLANSAWQAVEIDATGWRVIDAPPVRFRRAPGLRPLPIPERGGSVATLRRFLNVRGDADFTLVVAWLLAALRPHGPYPVLALSGEQGSAKSTVSAMLRALVDPATAALRALPREDRDLFIAAGNAHLLAFDNLSGLASGVSDTLCRLATGGGFAVRALYTDQDEVLFEAARPILLNGIEDVVARADLADRAILLQLEPIPDERRRPEAEIWAAFERERPRILGALLDAVSHGLRALPQTHLPRLPRMADFALWASACEGVLWDQGTFWAAYEGNRQEAVESVLEADPVAAALRAFMAERAEWVGTAAALLPLLAQVAGERVAKSKAWPQSPRGLSSGLRRAATALRKVGIEITHTKSAGKSRDRLIWITAAPAVQAAPPVQVQGADTSRIVLPATAQSLGTQPSAPSEPPALEAKASDTNGFEGAELRTVGSAADGWGQRETPTVRHNPLERQAPDDADGADGGVARPLERPEAGALGRQQVRL